MAYLSHYKMLPLTLLKIQFGSLFFTHVASSTNCCSQQALCHSSPPNICPFPFFFFLHLSIFIGSAKSLGSVTVSTPCESVSYTVAVPRTQSHYLRVHSVSPDRHSLCWFQIRHGLPPVSQAFGLYSRCFCLVLSFPLSSPRAWPTIDGEVASFLIFSTLTRFMSLWIDTFILL